MKINRKNPEHIKALFVSAAYSFVASAVSPILRIKKPPYKVIIFYGHTLNGNLKVFYDFLMKEPGYKPYFLVLDKNYLSQLKSNTAHPETILSALNFSDMKLVARADAFITSHGLHLMFPFRWLTGATFIDVWHAVSYKGFSRRSFWHLHGHDEIWVSSPYIRDIYINRFGFKRSKVKVTGYGRTDQLINGSLSRAKIIKKYSIPSAKKYVLIAPTWKQIDKGVSIIPFGLSAQKFFGELDKLAKRNHAQIIFRTHLNSDDEINVSHLTNTNFMPYGKYPVVEEFLFIADILVNDWSSTGIDYLPLKRPAIFLDVPLSFKHGFELGPEHRYGDVVKDFDGLKAALEKYLKEPEKFIKAHKEDIAATTKAAYGNSLDGKSLNRYFEHLKKLLKSNNG
jgi:CDP-glycerol glycerophosphotransferase